MAWTGLVLVAVSVVAAVVFGVVRLADTPVRAGLRTEHGLTAARGNGRAGRGPSGRRR